MKKSMFSLSDFISDEISNEGLKLISGGGDIKTAPVKESVKDAPIVVVSGPGGPITNPGTPMPPAPVDC